LTPVEEGAISYCAGLGSCFVGRFSKGEGSDSLTVELSVLGCVCVDNSLDCVSNVAFEDEEEVVSTISSSLHPCSKNIVLNVSIVNHFI
jgi:hypothetical protein